MQIDRATHMSNKKFADLADFDQVLIEICKANVANTDSKVLCITCNNGHAVSTNIVIATKKGETID
jgi:hypothetical protein